MLERTTVYSNNENIEYIPDKQDDDNQDNEYNDWSDDDGQVKGFKITENNNLARSRCYAASSNTWQPKCWKMIVNDE